MSKNPEVIVVGGGSNGLSAAAYLANAGVDTLVLEAKPFYGGGVITREDSAPGFWGDEAGTCHIFMQTHPLLRNDELGLMSKYGLKYIKAEQLLTIIFPNDETFTFWYDLDKTCEEIARFNKKDAEQYRKFYEWGMENLDMLVTGLHSPGAPFGALVSMLNGNPQGRELCRAIFTSAHDLAMQWFEDPHLINALDRWASENMADPRVDGSGVNLLLMIPVLHKYGMGYPIGGSQKLCDALVACIEDHGSEVRVNAPVKRFIVEDDRCIGVVLENGEEIHASKAVISAIGIRQLDRETLPGMPEEYYRGVDLCRDQQFMPFHQNVAFDKVPEFKASIANTAMMVEFCPDTIEEMNDIWDTFAHGGRLYDWPVVFTYSHYDETRAPKGKSCTYLYHYEPYFLKPGENWDDLREETSRKIIEDFCARTTNLTPDDVLGKWVVSPLDLERQNPAYYHGNNNHIGSQLYHSLGNRPIPLVSSYRFPIEGLYGCGASFPPGPGIICGGRSAVQVVMEDIDVDFEESLGL